VDGIRFIRRKPRTPSRQLTDNLIVFVPDGHGQQRIDPGIHDPVAALVLVDVQHLAGTRHPLRQAFQIPRDVFAFHLLPATVVRARVPETTLRAVLALATVKITDTPPQTFPN